MFIFGGSVVSWKSKKQDYVTRHIQEAEYNAYSTTTAYAIWIKRFLNNLDLNLIDGPVEIYCDNQAAISLINSGANSSRGKYIEIHYHYIRDILKK